MPSPSGERGDLYAIVKIVVQKKLKRDEKRLTDLVGTDDVAHGERVAGRRDDGRRDLRHLGDVVDDGIELTRQLSHLVVGQLDAREHAEMANKIRGDFRHHSSLRERGARPRKLGA